ncbi:MAG: fatty-acid oxidation protein subunit alpha [Chloroflexi bacterium]|nr:MAG: fatty-acid oxidation protein subunit alpha [Chloroflexota bacterium]
MPSLDIFHETVGNALDKDGWTITNNPLFLRMGADSFYIDFAAEKMIAAEKQGRKIAVEVKSFVGVSFATDFHLAVGQYMNYRLLLAEKEAERALYLAIPLDIYTSFLKREFVRKAIQQHGLRLLVFDPQKEEILEWYE